MCVIGNKAIVSHVGFDRFVLHLKNNELVHHVVDAVEHMGNCTKVWGTVRFNFVQAVVAYPPWHPPNRHTGGPAAHHPLAIADQPSPVDVPDSALKVCMLVYNATYNVLMYG